MQHRGIALMLDGNWQRVHWPIEQLVRHCLAMQCCTAGSPVLASPMQLVCHDGAVGMRRAKGTNMAYGTARAGMHALRHRDDVLAGMRCHIISLLA